MSFPWLLSSAPSSSSVLRGIALVIDDDEAVRELLVVLLCLAGYQVDAVQTGGDGVQAAKENDYDVVFCDMRMPGLRGDEVIAGILAAKPESDIYVVTAEPYGPAVTRALDLGARGCLSKPFSIAEFWKLVGEPVNPWSDA